MERRRPLYRRFPPGEPPADLLPEGSTAWLTEAAANSVVLLPVMVDGTVAAVVTAATCGDRPPVSPGDADLRIVARCLPSPSAAEVGGDRYDSVVLPDGATVLAIGDAAGHNLDAAVQMSQLRNMLRALSVDRLGRPGEILRRLKIVMESLAPDATATCALARVEQTQPDQWQLNYAVAGHPPPLLVTPDGDCRLLEDAANPLLGVVFDQPYDSAVEHLPPRSTVLLYTDGLVERPGEDLDQGLERLREQASALARRPLDGFCDGLLNSLLATTGTDDIALIALRAPTGSKPGP
nr:hypothetical protein GCM10010200_024500 [Actinomadura rugatobispora]